MTWLALLRHWKLAVGLLAIVASFGAGWRVSALRCDARVAKIERAAEKQRARQQATVNRKATQYERESADADKTASEREAKVRLVYRDRVVPAVCEPPADSGKLLDDAISDANRRARGGAG